MSTELMPKDLPISVWIYVIGCAFFWGAAYVLIIRRGFLDQSYGMPVTALCVNISWEVLFTTVYPSDYKLQRIGLQFWPLLDLIILITVLRFGPKEATVPFFQKWFRVLFFIGTGLAAALMLPFIRAFGDVHGIVLGWIDAILIAVLYFPMMYRRPDLRGQSIYIAICMFFGNLFAYLWNRYFPEVHPFDLHLVSVYACVALSLNLAYIFLLYGRLQAIGVRPFTRA